MPARSEARQRVERHFKRAYERDTLDQGRIRIWRERKARSGAVYYWYEEDMRAAINSVTDIMAKSGCSLKDALGAYELLG